MSDHKHAFGGDSPRTGARSKINPPRTVTANTANGVGRPGVDTSARMVTPIKNGSRVTLRGIRIKGSQQAVDVKGYVANVSNGIAKVETWGAIGRPLFIPVSALTFSGMAAR